MMQAVTQPDSATIPFASTSTSNSTQAVVSDGLGPAGPATPTLSLETPILSSASPDTPGKVDTPYLDIRTPAGRPRIGVGSRPAIGVGSVASLPPAESHTMTAVAGLGYGDALVEDSHSKDGMPLGREEGIEVAGDEIDMSPESVTIELSPDTAAREMPAPAIPVVVEVVEPRDTLPSDAELGQMEARIKELRSSAQDASSINIELINMVSSLLQPYRDIVPFLQTQIETQRATIKAMQEQTKLSATLHKIERERYYVERSGWDSQINALLNRRQADETAAGKPRKALDLDVGYHQELEAANKRLEMDNRLMAPRLADTQKQIDKLVTELRHLRSNVVLSSSDHHQFNGTTGPAQSRQQGNRGPSVSPAKTYSSLATMGDARTEHLLLAAKKVRSMRARNPDTGLITLEELKRHGIVGPSGGIGYSEGYGGVVEDSDVDEDSGDEDEGDYIAPPVRRGSFNASKGGKAKSSGPAPSTTPLLPRAKRSSKRNLPAPTTPKRRRGSVTAPPTTTPGGNFTDLLRAAEMATRPITPSRKGNGQSLVPLSTMSATRSTNIAREDTVSDRGSPVKRPAPVGEEMREWESQNQLGPVPVPDGEGDAPQSAPHGGSGPVLSSQDGHSHTRHSRKTSALDILASASQLQDSDPEESQKASAEKQRIDTSPKASSTLPMGVETPSKSSMLAPALDISPSSTFRPVVDDDQIDPLLKMEHDPTPLPSIAEDPMSGQGGGEMEGEENFDMASLTPGRRRKSSETSTIATPARIVSFPMESPYDEALGAELPLGAFASPTGGTVPGLGKYVHSSLNMPARRVRSPYLKWTTEEDELLARAVAMHGEKWDLVSKGVPTRSYHQVRQRWLRKTGAFDKKPGGTGDHHGASGLSHYEVDDRELSPTPLGGKAKKRKF